MTGDSAVHVFLGPSLPAAEARAQLPRAVLHPPVAQGDVLRTLYDRPAAIAIIDGYFELVPAVWHKEILVALAEGVPVFGASSMGALRAAELHRFGMVGYGRVFEWFRDGVLDDDGDVAVAHAGAEDGFRPLSDALVDLRDLYARAVDAGVIGPTLRDRLLVIARALPYHDRSARRVVQDARAAYPDAGDDLAGLTEFCAVSGPGLKARDARGLLDLLAAADLGDPTWRPTPVSVVPTVFLHQLASEVDLARAAGSEQVPDRDVPIRGIESHAVLRKKVLMRLLARQVAALVPVPVDEGDLADALVSFRAEFDLDADAEFDAWRQREGVTDAALRSFLWDGVLIDKLELQRAHDIAPLVADQLRITSARARRDRGADDPMV